MFWLNVAIILSSILSLAEGHGYLIDRDLIAKKDGFKFNFRSGSGVIRDQGFRSLGCWKDTWIRAIKPLEKRHQLLMDGNYKLREDPLRKCAIAALDNHMKLFAIENGGQCLGATSITSSYKKYGNADHCKDDGYGGPWSMQVYGFTGPKLKHRHGGYTKWSMWTKCSSACGKGIQKRYRTCTNPSPTQSGRNCKRLGPTMEKRSCETECLGTEDDELENPDQAGRSTAKSKKPWSKAIKKSDDTNDYLEDDDNDDDDYDHEDDDVSNPSEDETSNTDDYSDTKTNHEASNKLGQNAPDAKMEKPLYNTVESSIEKTESGDLGLKSTGDTTKSNTKIASYESVLSKSNSKGANTVSKTTTDIPLGNEEGNSDQSGLLNDDKSVMDQSDLPKSGSDASSIGDATKQPVSPLSQGTSDIQPSNIGDNTDQSNSQLSGSESTLANDASDISKSNSKGTGTTQSPGTTDSQPGSTGDNIDQSNGQPSGSESTIENDASDISKSNSKGTGTTQSPGTTDSQPGSTGDNIDQSNGQPSGSESTIENDASDISKSNNKGTGTTQSPGTTDRQAGSTGSYIDQSNGQQSGSESTIENDASGISKSNNKDSDTSKAGSNDKQPGSTGESTKQNDSNDLPPTDDKSTMEDDASDSETSNDDTGENTKDSTSHGTSSITGSELTDVSSSSASKGLPDKQQMKAAQDLLRSRWLSLAKNGRLKPAPTELSVNSSKPVVDVSLKEDSVEDFEDKEMEDEFEKENEQKSALEKVEGQEDDLTTDEGKQDEQGDNLEGSQLNGKKVDEQVSDQTTDDGKQQDNDETTDSKTEEEQNNKANDMQMNGKKIEDTANDHSIDRENQEGQEDKLDNQEDKTNEKEHEKEDESQVVEHEEKVDDQQVNNDKTNEKEDNQGIDGALSVEHAGNVDEKQMGGDNVQGSEGVQSVKEEDMEEQVEALSDHKEDESEMEETEDNLDGNTKDEGHTMTQERGAKRIKEECICPKVVCLHLADTGMFIDNSNVTDINDLAEMKSFAKGLAAGFMTKDEDVQMGIIGNGMGRSHIPGVPRKSEPGNQARNLITHLKSRLSNQAQNLITHPESRHSRQRHHILTTNPKTGSWNQAFKRSQLNRLSSIFHPENGHHSQAFKRAEAYLLAKQKKAIPPILNDVLFVLVSGGESDVEVHAPVKDLKDAGAKIVAIGVGKDAKIGELGSQADKQFMVPPGAGNAIVNAIIAAVCKPDLMGKIMPNPKPCTCMTEPSKKASTSEKPSPLQDKAGRKLNAEMKKLNAEMTKEEYKTGMFHASALPKLDSLSVTPPQKPSETTGTTLPTTSSTTFASNAKPPTAISETKPLNSGGNLPALKTSPDTLPETVKTSTGNQPASSSSQPATQPKPAIQPVARLAPQPASSTLSSKNTPSQTTDKVVHIKHDKFKPLSNTLSLLGESINKAHATGKLKEGSYALDSDIHNLLKTIGKLKSQVDILRHDQPGIAPESPGQSEVIPDSAGQSSSSMASTSQSPQSSENTDQSQSNTNAVDESNSSAGLSNTTLSKTGSHMPPLKLRIIGKTASKKLKNSTILHLELSDQLKPNTTLVKPMAQNPTIHQINTVSTSSVPQNAALPQTVSTNAKQSQQTGLPTPAKLVQQDTQSTTPNEEAKLTQPAKVASGKVVEQPQLSTIADLTTQNTVSTKPTTSTNTATENIPSQSSSTPQSLNQTQTAVPNNHAVTQPNTAASPNVVASAKLTTQPTTTVQTATISATPPAQSGTTFFKPKTFFQDTKLTKPTTDPNTKNILQQIITTQKAKTLPLKTQTSPITQKAIAPSDVKLPTTNPETIMLPQQSTTTTQKAKPVQVPSKATTLISPITQNGIATVNTKLPITNPQKPNPPERTVTTTQKAEAILPKTQISPITQSGSTTDTTNLPKTTFLSTIPHAAFGKTAGQFTTANPGVASSSLTQTPLQNKPNKFAAIESHLARYAATPRPVQKSSVPACNINLGFVLDGSASVEGTRRGNFLKMINFVKDVIHEFVKLSQQVHVGTMVYSTNTSLILSFGTKGTEKVINQILDSVHYPGQGSLTGKAIKESWNQMFASVPRGRKSKLLLLTDGPSNDDIKVPSKWVRDNGVEFFVIGLGKGYDESQLTEMASLPNNKHMMIKDYDELRASVQEVRNKLCGFNAEQVLQIMTSPRYSDSLQEINAYRRNFGSSQCILDVVFLLDGSRQVETNGVGNFQREINFVKKAAKHLPVSRDDVHIGVGLLGDANVMVFPLNEHYIQNSIDFELNHIRYPASSDIQPEELKYARKLMLTKGARDVAPRVFVLVTDVSSIDSYRKAVNELRTEGSEVAMLGVGTSLWKQVVKVRSSVPGLVDQVVTMDSGDDDEAAKHFAINMCKLSNSKRTEIPRRHWAASDKVLNND